MPLLLPEPVRVGKAAYPGEEDIRGAATADPDLAAYELRLVWGLRLEENEIVGYLVLFETRLREFSRRNWSCWACWCGYRHRRRALDARGEPARLHDVASHELRHPITIMKGYAETMGGDERADERRDVGGRPARHRPGADRLETLVAELLGDLRIERERFIMVKRLPSDDLVAQALVEMNRRKLDNPFSLRVIGESVPVWADPTAWCNSS